MGEDELVEAALAGDRRALDDLLRSHHDRLYAVCRRITGNAADAADATQETLIAVVRGLRRFDRRSRFSTWTYRIAVNASLDELRRRNRRPEPGLDVYAAPAGLDLADRVAEDSANRLDIDAALAHLVPEFRAAVVLRDLCGLDYAEIAEVLDIPAGTVRSRIARGRAALVPLLADKAGAGQAGAGQAGAGQAGAGQAGAGQAWAGQAGHRVEPTDGNPSGLTERPSEWP